ncbi:MAG: right-handed parallel beta-helix repeat-containing protein [Thermoanaerobaculia bacterium]
MQKNKQGIRRNEKRDTRIALTISGGAALTLGVALSPGLEAATFTVTNLNDAGAGSLRQAIVDANGAAGADVVAFQAGLTGTITLTTGQLEITDSADVQGPGASSLTVSGNNASRIFYLYSASLTPIDVTISGLTITGGNAPNGGGVYLYGEHLTLDNVVIGGNTASSDGGGVWADGYQTMTLTIRNSMITGNTAGIDGGGIYIEDTEDIGGLVLIENSVISGNSAADDGGGIYFYDPDDDVTIRDSTISGNSAGDAGGGIYLYSPDNGLFTIRGTTISGNTAAAGGGVFLYSPDHGGSFENSTISGNQATAGNGGGIYLYNLYNFAAHHLTVSGNSASGNGGGIFLYATLPLDNSIVANNTAGVNNDLGNGDAGGVDLSYSLIESPDSANINDIVGNVFNQDPQLGALANNGGPTMTQLPAAASPVVNTGSSAFTVDQRGVTRPVGAAVDMGAVEVNPGVVQFTVTAAAVNETDLTLTLTVTRTGGSDGAISVNYAATPGTAVTPGDYTLAGGTLNWASGDAASKTFNITIVNDTVAEPAETFTVALAGPVGATIGANSSVTVTINASAGPPIQPGIEVPALGLLGKIALMLGTAFAAFWALGRKLFVVFLFTLLAASVADNASAAAAHPAKGHGAAVTQISVVTPSPGSIVSKVSIKLEDGTVVSVDPRNLKVADHRSTANGKATKHARTKGNSLDGIATNQPAIVKVKKDEAGNVTRVRIKLYDSLAEANDGLAGKD